MPASMWIATINKWSSLNEVVEEQFILSIIDNGSGVSEENLEELV